MKTQNSRVTLLLVFVWALAIVQSSGISFAQKDSSKDEVLRVKEELSKDRVKRILQGLYLMEALERGIEGYLLEEIPLYLSKRDLVADLSGGAAGAAAGGATAALGIWGLGKLGKCHPRLHFLMRSIGTSHARLKRSVAVVGGVVVAGPALIITWATVHDGVLARRKIADDFPGFAGGTQTVLDFAKDHFQLKQEVFERIQSVVNDLRIIDLYEQSQGISPKKIDVKEILFSSDEISRDDIERVAKLRTYLYEKALAEKAEFMKNHPEESWSSMFAESQLAWLKLYRSEQQKMNRWISSLTFLLDLQIGKFKRDLEAKHPEFGPEKIQELTENKFGLVSRSVVAFRALLMERSLD
jgi:hypothetical protein